MQKTKILEGTSDPKEKSIERPVCFDEVAEFLKTSRPKLRELISSGKIRSHKAGDKKRFFFIGEVIEDIKSL